MFRVEMRGIVKEFSGVRVLDNVDFLASAGEVHALVGENGAGKSTLMKILAGAYRPTAGTMAIDGQPISLGSPGDGLRAGISVIHQEVNIVPDFTVAENVFLNVEPRQPKLPIIDRKTMYRRTQEILERFGLKLDPRARGRSLSVAEKQLAMIGRALLFDARVLIMDEPTSSLTDEAVEALMKTVSDLRSRGLTIVYISHRLDEVLRIADRITVLKDGAKAGTLDRAAASLERIIELMLSRSLDEKFPPKDMHPKDEALRLTKAADGKRVKSASLYVRHGEIVGLTGLLGAGKTEVARLAYGVSTLKSGSIAVDGKPVAFRWPQDALAAGVTLVPENRREQGFVVGDTVRRNVTLASLSQFAGFMGAISQSREKVAVRQLWDLLNIRGTGIDQRVRYLSGGNQQKVVLAKCLCTKPKVLVLDEPTKGIDVGAKLELYRIVADLAAQGCGILWVTMEIPEIVGMCDRVYVMRGGQVVSELDTRRESAESIYSVAAGGALPTA